MPTLNLLEVRTRSRESAERLDALFPDGVVCLERLLPTPEELPERWEDARILAIYVRARGNGLLDRACDDTVGGIFIPGTVTPGTALDYLSDEYPELVEPYARLSHLYRTYGARDKREWRVRHWGAASEPETLKTRTWLPGGTGPRVDWYAVRYPHGGASSDVFRHWSARLGPDARLRRYAIRNSGELYVPGYEYVNGEYLVPAGDSVPNLAYRGITPLYAFTRRESVEEVLPDGSTRKTAVFRHAGFIPACQ